jgi:putative endonuclease
LYTGYAVDVERRVALHNAGRGARYTSGRRPVRLMASWAFASKGDALREEHRIKRLDVRRKLRLVSKAKLTF